MRVGGAALKRQPIRGNRYQAPYDWLETRVSEILAGTSRWDTATPPQLSFLTDANQRHSEIPDRVFAIGDVDLLKRPCVSIIGTRQVSADGASRARRVARELAKRGIVVVSGLAEGVDTEAMTEAIAAGGRVVGVIGTPLDKAYPASNATLQETVYRDHLLVSQFAAGEKVWPANFPRRNRLMAILSDASVVIEASDTSGTLHQAAECTKQGRWLFIAKSVVEDPTVTWPAKFLKYDTCVVLEKIEDITTRILPQTA